MDLVEFHGQASWNVLQKDIGNVQELVNSCYLVEQDGLTGLFSRRN